MSSYTLEHAPNPLNPANMTVPSTTSLANAADIVVVEDDDERATGSGIRERKYRYTRSGMKLKISLGMSDFWASAKRVHVNFNA